MRLAVAHEMHEAADRVGFGGIARDAGGLEGRRRCIAFSPTHTANTGFGGNKLLRCFCDHETTDFAASIGEASAVGTFMTRTASLSGSASSASSAAA